MPDSIQVPDVEIQLNYSISGLLRLDMIREVARVSEGKALQLMETAIWCLDFCHHSNGIHLEVREPDGSFYYAVKWPKQGINLEAIKHTYNQDDATEDGAEAIAFLICIERTEYTVVERASKRTGIDYWLGFKNTSPNLPFHKAGRLEISGMMTETKSNKMSTRIQSKLRQTAPTDYTSLPVYAILVEFSKPYASMVLKNAKS